MQRNNPFVNLYITERTMLLKKFLLFFMTYIILTLIPLASFAANGNQAQEIKVYVNDTRVQFDVPPIVIQDRTMVPIRAVFEAMGADVQWDNSTRTAIITKDMNRVQVQLDNQRALVNGSVVWMDVAATGINGRTLVPVRFISENLGLKVDWVNETKTVFINEPSEAVNIGNLQNWGKFTSNGTYNFFILQNNTLVREHITTRRQEKIADHILSDLQFYKDWIYCIAIDKGLNRVIRMNPDGTGKEIIINAAVQSFQIVNDWIYYGDPNNPSTLIRTKTDGTDTVKILQDGDFSAKSWFVQNGFVYYRKNSTGALYRARIDGSESVQLTMSFENTMLPTGNRGQTAGNPAFSLKLVDDQYIYFVLEAGSNENNRVPGVYRLPLGGGKAQLLFEKTPISINMDTEWLYMAVKGSFSSQLVKCRKDGTKAQTINEYKENDVPGNIYVNNSVIYYTLQRGSSRQELFRMNPEGGNITQVTWSYGPYQTRLKEILSSVESAHKSLKSYSTFQISKDETGKQIRSQTSDLKVNRQEVISYENIQDEKEQTDYEVWVDDRYIYSKYSDERLWNVEEHGYKANFMANDLFSFLQPNEELYNNLTIRQSKGKLLLSGSSAYPNLMNSLVASGRLVFNKPFDFIESATINLTIDEATYFVEEFTIEIKYYPQPYQNGSKASISRYSFINSRFNSTLIYVPSSLKQSLDAKMQADQKTVQAQKLMREGKYQDAVKLFDEALNLYPKTYQAYLYKGQAQYYLGQYKEAILSFDRYRDIAPEDIEVLWLEGWCYLKLGDTSRAEQLAQKALNLDSNNVIALNLMGSVAAAKEEYKDARSYYQTAIALDRNYYEAHLNLATTYFNMGSYTKCIQTIDEFLNRFPSDRELMYLKAQSYSRQGKNMEAIRVYEQILSKNPSNDFVTMTYIAIEYEALQNYTKAQEYASKAQKVYGDYNLLKSLLERLIYSRSTSSSQKLVDFIRKNYLYYKETNTVAKAFDNITAKQNGYTIDNVKQLIDMIKSPEDNSTFVLYGKDFNTYMNLQDSSYMEAWQEGKTVYFSIKTFTRETGVMFTEFIQNIDKPEEKTLIIDLRDNNGGLSNEANIMLDALLPECTPSYIIERDGYISSFRSDKNHTKFKKIGLLVNENTASSSELLALGLKTYAENVTIIGRKTMGRGVGQTVYVDRTKGYALFLVNHYWNVLQQNINDQGLPIDIRVNDNDPDYQKAISEFLKK